MSKSQHSAKVAFSEGTGAIVSSQETIITATPHVSRDERPGL